MSRSQRWRHRREAYVPDATTINPAEYAVDAIDCATAKAFVLEHHYSGTFPASRLSVGLYRGRQLAGVAVFSVPMNNAAVPIHTGLADPLAGVDLGRFVLLDDVAGNGETWFLARAFRQLRQEKPGVVAVVSYADPAPRRTATGDVVKPGHVGQIYQAMSASYRGRARARFEHMTPDGQPFSERAASKIKNRESGHAYAIDELVRRGASRPASDDLRGWYGGLLESGFITRRRHPGNHVYAFPLTRAARLAGRQLPQASYPKADAQAAQDATALPLFQLAA
jgi:hypothetical protein